MQFLPTILTALSLLLPTSGREGVVPVGLNTSVVSWERASFDHGCVATIRRPCHLPSPSRLFLESLDESALGEEESDEIEPSTATSHVVFGEEAFSTYLLSPSSPHRLHSSITLARSILRC